MKLECSLDLKKCTCERNFCRKSSSIHPQLESSNSHSSYHQRQAASISKHSDSTGCCLLSLLLCVGLCCSVLPICGVWIGPILYYVQLNNGQQSPTIVSTMSPTMSLTMSPTMSPTIVSTMSHIVTLLNDTSNNMTNITI
jgi:hypothetical protein